MKTNLKNLKNDMLNYKLYVVLVVIAALSIFMISARHISVLTNIGAWDELGYWGNAAYLAGYDWSSAVSAFSGYYSYGYSLILALLLKLCRNSNIAYQMAITLNALFMVGSFFLANYIGIKCFKLNNRYCVLLVSFAVIMYVNNITQVNFAWTECLLIFLYWCLSALYCSLNQRYRFSTIILIIILTIYIYFVHNRSLGIVVASLLTLSAYVFLKKMQVRKVIFLVAGMLLLFLIGVFWKNDIKSAVYIAKSDKELVNTFSAVSPWIIGKLLSVYGIVDLVKTFLNRFLYFGIMTFGTFGFVCYWGVKKLREKNTDFFVLFLFLSVLGTFGLMSLQLSQSGSYQALLYGRYQDIVIGPFFLMGLLLMILKVDSKNWFHTYIFTFPILLKILIEIAKSIPIYNDYFVPNCNVSLYKFWIGTENGGYEFDTLFLFSVLGMIVLCLISFVYQKMKVSGSILLSCFVILYSGIQYNMSEDLFNTTFNHYCNMSDGLEEIHEICKDASEIYYCQDKALSINIPAAMWLQFEMFDQKVVVIENLENIKENSYVVIPRRKISDTVFEPTIEIDGTLVLEANFIALYRI